MSNDKWKISLLHEITSSLTLVEHSGKDRVDIS